MTVTRRKSISARDRSNPKAPQGSRHKWFKLIALTVVPALLLIVGEILFRTLGFGYPASFFLETQMAGREVLVENRQFGRRFFPAELVRTPTPFVLPATKDPQTLRVFVLGESAAMGDPEPAFGLPRMLEVLLKGRYPGRKFEVINTAMTAINSHVILPVARECAKQRGDVWVVYMGNNEVVGPFGSGTVFGPQVPPRPLIQANLLLQETRIGQLVATGLRNISAGATRPKSWEGMEMFLGQQVAAKDPKLAKVYEHFASNLRAILQLGTDSGASVIVSTVASNLKDNSPFGSLQTKGASDADQARWAKTFKAGVDLEQAKNHAGAVPLYEDAARQDPHFASLQFRLGRCYYELGRDVPARERFIVARDEDTLRFRADSRLNEIIRQTVASWKGAGIHLVDAEQELARLSPRGIPGEDLFYEHVHFNFHGNYELARLLASQIAALPALQSGSAAAGGWLSESECADRLGYTIYDQLEILAELKHRFESAPFNQQLDHSIRMESLSRRWTDLKGQAGEEGRRRALAIAREAVTRSPEDWVLHERLAKLQSASGDLAGATAEWRRVLELMPRHTTAHQELGNLLDVQGKSAEAQACFEASLRLRPNLAGTINSLGLSLANQGRYEEAYRQYARALELRPNFSSAQVNWGLALAAQKKFPDAEFHYRQALRLDSRDELAHFNLGLALVAQEKREEAMTHYQRALEINPGLYQAHYQLAMELSRTGKAAEAITHLTEMVRLAPEIPEGHFRLGLALSDAGKAPEAIEQLRATLKLMPNHEGAANALRQLVQSPGSP